MQEYQYQFIQFSLNHQVLRFGEFTLKSGRVSPYFFNAGLFCTGNTLANLGRYYATAIENSSIAYDMLYGPAYKGIPLVSAAAIALADQHSKNIGYCFNRKEVKDHGEGGNLVGTPLTGRVLIIDDVITAGTAIRESLAMIEKAGAKPAGIVVALDRQERGQSALSSIQEIEQQHNIPVISIIKLDHLLEYLNQQPGSNDLLEQIYRYREQYGIAPAA